MPNLIAVAVATVAAFVASSTYYTVFAGALAAQLGTEPSTERPPVWKILVELVRSLTVTVGFAVALSQLDVTGPAVLLFALVVWLVFPVAILSGSIVWDSVPWRLAAIHAGDWLLKAVLIALVVGLWR
jgi:Protein of unknown function (DUF1761)